MAPRPHVHSASARIHRVDNENAGLLASRAVMTDTAASATLAAEAHRLLAFIYFACAEADGVWTNEETIALYDFLAAHAGDLGREQSVAIAREAFDWLAGVDGNEARLRVIEEHVPRTFAHLPGEARSELLDDLIELAQADGKLSRDEAAMHARIRRALLGPASTTDLPELRLIAFIFQLLAHADGRVDSDEVGKIRALLRARAPKATKRQIRETIEQAAAWYHAAQSDDARIAHLERAAAALHWTLNSRERNDLLVELIGIASADGNAETVEGDLVRKIRGALVRQLRDEELRLLAFIYFTCADADGDWTNQETLALYEFLERESSGLPRDRSVALAQEAYQWLLGVPDLDARLAVLDDRVPHALAHLSELEREEVITNLLDLARTDHGVTATEQRVRDRIRALLK